MREQQWQRQKENEINPVYDIREEQKDERPIQLEAQMLEKSALINDLTQSIYQHSSEEEIAKIREKIQGARRELERLWHQQALIEQESEQQLLLNSTRLCA
ncbi:Uncharacterised protein [Legionella lansingensis]|uniref:Coiled-coil protein n=1 Tax=Legionella lansingensis TaxID=45067 RepID=A0A0W0VEP1_9GAMM|nr:hypothetical protein [Legionella lansingensis]KTD18570.1 hypothetical protein Llan_2488 [Legionella lansingensis]SNV49372.1 Uncharacterised protein [Legionella lansingensis]